MTPEQIFQKQFENRFKVGNSTLKERIAKLNNLRYAVEVTYRHKLVDALYTDFKKPKTESDLTEIYPVVSEIKFVCKHLKSWMSKQRVETPIALFGASSWIKYESKGVCLIMSPWNFPVNLTLGPLVSAIAAGNTVILKPSEMTPNASNVLAELIRSIFNEDEVALIEGGAETAQELLKLPFHHIFFTGSPAIGKLVMKAAAEHLTSVTLELGGKSPTIIDETADIKTAARRIAWGKFMNCGQICVSPDYVLVHKAVKDDFLKAIKKNINEFFTEHPERSDSYSRIVNDKHFQRLKGYLSEVSLQAATIEFGGGSDPKTRYIQPTVISDIDNDSSLMQNEIFGPILPVITYESIDEAIRFINKRDKPLALYVYSRKRKLAENIINETRAGSSCINHNVLQYGNHYLPFGGSNTSGLGKSHGFYGFQEFSNSRSVLKQHIKGATDMLFPPYTDWKKKLVGWTVKWF
ncbi:aldehyde dehydrogenase family protein [Mangrovimonas aestuarii]|uniref:aldehyde dehydrogenase family protein n=1 Tax=Mangrovimonas aestuarii TaxID=3018443 RepID=UPI00237A04D2|nr:aldehyde dehydrogenase family protein [Mangrovimonas aestuarii]